MTIESAIISSDVSSDFLYGPPRVHEQRSNIHHWQLRDLVLHRTDPGFEHEMLLPRGQDIFRYDPRTAISKPLIKSIGYPPTCIATGCGYFAAGGQRGDLMVKDLTGEYSQATTTAPNHTINNGLCFYRVGDQIRLLVCNNDATIRMYSVPELHLMDTIHFQIAVNSVAVSPDGAKMVSVGDDNQVCLHSITRSGYPELVSTMAVSRDSNFSVSWSHDSDRFAVASQDGTVHVWDIRSRNPLCRLGGQPRDNGDRVTAQSLARSAARCVKFSQSRAVDLLAYTEHVSHVHVVDARTFDAVQTIRVGPAHRDTNISGLSFAPDSQSLFIGVEDALLEYQVDVSVRRRFPHGALL